MSREHGGERFTDISELFENSCGQCLQARTDSLGEGDYLVGSYHYVLGVDTSSSASIAAYVNSLTYSLASSIGWFRSNPWKITRSVFCSFNAFTGVDVRVEARIPGGVTAYAITAAGTKIPTTTEMWQETFVSSILRSIHQSDFKLIGLRRIDPIATDIMERRFLESLSRLFWSGWQLGAANGQSSGTNINNFLSIGVLKYFQDCQRPHLAIEFFENFTKKDPEVVSLISQCLLFSDREPEAVKVMHDALVKNGASISPVLVNQCEFLISKRRYDEAVEIGRAAVKASPVDHTAWITLAKALIKVGKHDSALTVLNTCPVAPNPEPESIRMAPLTKTWVPQREGCLLDEVSQQPCEDSILERLKGSRLRGALKQAYSVLVELVSATGWDDLLKLRSRIFLMEEEYRAQRSERRDSEASEMEQIPLDDYQSRKEGKRMCERWLDNLFMILFDDMRVYTIYRGELQHFRGENMPYQRTAREWLILGTLCRRLGNIEEAKEAYRQCVETTFCEEAWQALLEVYSDEGRLAHALTAASKLLLHQTGHFHTTLVFFS